MTARVAIVGVGLVGVRHIDAIKQTHNVVLSAIVDTSANAKRIAQDNNVAFYPSLEALFDHDKPDGVLLSTPTTLHLQQGLECIAAQCPVLIEKPITVTAAEAKILVDSADENSVPVLVGHHRRYNPLIQKAHSLIEEGTIGTIRSAQGICWLYKPE